jgi:hypothetical protein
MRISIMSLHSTFVGRLAAVLTICAMLPLDVVAHSAARGVVQSNVEHNLSPRTASPPFEHIDAAAGVSAQLPSDANESDTILSEAPPEPVSLALIVFAAKAGAFSAVFSVIYALVQGERRTPELACIGAAGFVLGAATAVLLVASGVSVVAPGFIAAAQNTLGWEMLTINVIEPWLMDKLGGRDRVCGVFYLGYDEKLNRYSRTVYLDHFRAIGEALLTQPLEELHDVIRRSTGGAIVEESSAVITVDYTDGVAHHEGALAVTHVAIQTAQPHSDHGGYAAFVTPGLSNIDVQYSLSGEAKAAALELLIRRTPDSRGTLRVHIADHIYDVPVGSGIEPQLSRITVDEQFLSGANRLTISILPGSTADIGVHQIGFSAHGTSLTSRTEMPPHLSSSASSVVVGGSVDLTWTAVSGATRYVLERTQNGTYRDYNAITTEATSYRQQFPSPGEVWLYRVRADNSGLSNEVSVSVLATQSGDLQADPPAVALMGWSATPNDYRQDVHLQVLGRSSFTWAATATYDRALGNWLVLETGSGTQDQPLRVRANAQNLPIGIHTAQIDITSSQAGNSPLRLPVRFDVRDGSSGTGVDLAVVDAVLSGDYRTRGRQARLDWVVRNVGTTSLPQSATSPPELWDLVVHTTNPTLPLQNIDRFRIGWHDFNARKGLAPGDTARMYDTFLLPDSAYAVGQSYLIIITDAERIYDDSPRGWLPEPNDTDRYPNTNNVRVVPVFIPRPAQLAVDPTLLTLQVRQDRIASAILRISNSGDHPLNWSITSSHVGLTATPDSGPNGGDVVLTVHGAAFDVGVTRTTLTVHSTGGTRTITLDIDAQPIPPLQISTTSLPSAQIGTLYSATFEAGGGVAPYTWSVVESSLPAGISYSSAGQLAGTPTASGAYAIDIRVHDAAGATADGTYSLIVTTPPQIVLSRTEIQVQLDEGASPVEHTVVLSNSGGGPLNWTAHSSAPWLSLGVQAGSLQPAESFSVVVAIDPGGLPRGRHIAQVDILAPAAINSPRSLWVDVAIGSCSVSLNASPAVGGLTTLVDGTAHGPCSRTIGVRADPASGFEFVSWTKGGAVVSTSPTYTLLLEDHLDLVADFRDVTSSAPFKVTGAYYPETADLQDAVEREFGPAYRLADWNDVRSSANQQPVAWADALGMRHTDSYLVSWNDSRYYGYGRHYYMQRWSDRSPYAGFFAHDDIDGRFLVLGSWYGLNYKALAVHRGNCTVSATADPVGGGTATVSSGGYSGLCGRTVAVLAAPQPDFEFFHWTVGGEVVSTHVSHTFTASSDVALVAHFLPLCRVSVAVNPSDGGVAAVVEGGSEGSCGRAVVVEATAAPGFGFSGWSEDGATVALEPRLSLIVATPLHLVAQFEATCSIAIVASPAAGGVAELLEGELIGKCGRNVSVRANAAPGYHFDSWAIGDEVVSTNFMLTLTIDHDVLLNAQFVPDCTVGLSAEPTGGGQAEIVRGTASGPCGRTIAIAAVPGLGYAFAGWHEGDSVVSASATFEFVVNTHRELVATFASLCTIEVVSSPADGGQAVVTTGGTVGICGRPVTVSALPAAGFLFRHWSEHGDSISGAQTMELVVDRNRLLTARFDHMTHVLALHGSGSGSGRIRSAPQGVDCVFNAGAPSGSCTQAFSSGTQVVLTAAPAESSILQGWSGGCSGTHDCGMTLVSDTSVSVAFMLRVYSIHTSVDPVGSGTVHMISSDEFRHGSTITLTATAAAGWEFAAWTEQDAIASTDSSWTFILTAERTVAATFRPIMHMLTVTASGNGSGTVISSPEGISCVIVAGVPGTGCSTHFVHGGVVLLQAQASTDSHFVGWTGDCAGREPCSLTPFASASINAVFARMNFNFDQLAGALHSPARLSPIEREYLDAMGNKNGRYDIGDFLAWLRRNGQ